jgi:hypothetical protein
MHARSDGSDRRVLETGLAHCHRYQNAAEPPGCNHPGYRVTAHGDVGAMRDPEHWRRRPLTRRGRSPRRCARTTLGRHSRRDDSARQAMLKIRKSTPSKTPSKVHCCKTPCDQWFLAKALIARINPDSSRRRAMASAVERPCLRAFLLPFRGSGRRSAVHPTSAVRHRRRAARAPAPRSGSAARAEVHGQFACHRGGSLECAELSSAGPPSWPPLPFPRIDDADH